MMVVYIASAIILFVICLNWILGEKLYRVPSDSGFFDNVTMVSTEKNRRIVASPMYVTIISIMTGVVLGIYFAYVKANKVNNIIISIIAMIIFVCYLIEITRKIEIADGKLILSKFLYKTKYINLRRNIRDVYL